MRLKLILTWLGLLAVVVQLARAAEEIAPLAGTQPLTLTGDLSAQMVAGIDKFLMRETEKSIAGRAQFWKRDFSSPEAYEKSVQPNRERLRQIIGAVDERLRGTQAASFEFTARYGTSAKRAARGSYEIWEVSWPVFEGVRGEGLLILPQEQGTGVPMLHPIPQTPCVIVLPDADQTPEMLTGLSEGLPAEQQTARRLADNGCTVLVPQLVNRQEKFSGNRKLNRFTNQPHREWIYRQSFEMSRHIIGYEVQKVLAAVDLLILNHKAMAVAGYGEGGLIALHAAALDTRIQAALVSGYFDSRQRVWEEPIYRNVFGLLREFGDAEIASLITPRRLIVECTEAPKIDGPPPVREGRFGAAPGRIVTPDFLSVEAEVNRANELTRELKKRPPVELVSGAEGMLVAPGSERALLSLLAGLGVEIRKLESLPSREEAEAKPGSSPTAQPTGGGYGGGASGAGRSVVSPAWTESQRRDTQDFLNSERQSRQVGELVRHTQQLFRDSERVRDELVWKQLKGKSDAAWEGLCRTNRARLWEDAIGQFPKASLPLNPRSRRVHDEAKWTGYDVVLDVWPDVFAWGLLLVPKDVKPGEPRPVVVCQHGLEGVPEDVIVDNPTNHAFQAYQAFAARLVERGFIVYAPHNPYRGGDKFRVLQRKANPLGKSLFSVIIAQHDATLDWLATLPFVDSQRIGFYGLSYGGKTAMRVPAVLERYCLSICSGDFNEWVQKTVSVDSPYSYLFTGEYEMPEWNLGHTFNYAEMASLIAPRPFMVERGHFDAVAPDPWVAAEYAKVRKMYDVLGLPERTEIEFFNGPHRIHGVGTFRFLHKHLNWPEPK